MDRRNFNNNRDMNINDDYLELLNKVDEYEDIYSDSSDDFEDISSSSGDIYIGSGRRTSSSQNDVYFNDSRRVSDRAAQEDDFEDVRIYRPSNGANQYYQQPVTRNEQGYAQQSYGYQNYAQPANVQPVSKEHRSWLPVS